MRIVIDNKGGTMFQLLTLILVSRTVQSSVLTAQSRTRPVVYLSGVEYHLHYGPKPLPVPSILSIGCQFQAARGVFHTVCGTTYHPQRSLWNTCAYLDALLTPPFLCL